MCSRRRRREDGGLAGDRAGGRSHPAARDSSSRLRGATGARAQAAQSERRPAPPGPDRTSAASAGEPFTRAAARSPPPQRRRSVVGNAPQADLLDAARRWPARAMRHRRRKVGAPSPPSGGAPSAAVEFVIERRAEAPPETRARARAPTAAPSARLRRRARGGSTRRSRQRRRRTRARAVRPSRSDASAEPPRRFVAADAARRAGGDRRRSPERPRLAGRRAGVLDRRLPAERAAGSPRAGRAPSVARPSERRAGADELPPSAARSLFAMAIDGRIDAARGRASAAATGSPLRRAGSRSSIAARTSAGRRGRASGLFDTTASAADGRRPPARRLQRSRSPLGRGHGGAARARRRAATRRRRRTRAG